MRGQVAAMELDRMWDGWAETLSRSHESTMRLLEEGKFEAAHAEFKEHFHVTVKLIYSEAAVCSPQRYAKTADWGTWLRHLYALSIAAERGLRPAVAGSEAGKGNAVAVLEKLRGHFYRLAVENEGRTSGDYVYAFYQEVIKDRPDGEVLKGLRGELEKAGVGAMNDSAAYEKARGEWGRQVDAILAGGAVGEEQVKALRAGTEPFYRAYGRRIVWGRAAECPAVEMPAAGG